MKKFSKLVLLGSSLLSGLAFAQGGVTGLKEIPIGEMRVWDCLGDAAPGGCQYSGLCGYQRDEWVAKRLQGQMLVMSSIHWSLGPIVPSYKGDELKGPATFSVGVFEDSRIPDIDEIVSIGRSATKCGEFVAGPYHYPF